MFQHIVKISVFQHIVKISRGSELCAGSRVLEAHLYTQDRDRFRPLKGRLEVSMRNLSREDRDAFNRAKQKEWTSWLDKEAVELLKDRLKVPRSHILQCPLGVHMEERWNRESSESSVVRTWFSGPAFDHHHLRP